MRTVRTNSWTSLLLTALLAGCSGGGGGEVVDKEMVAPPDPVSKGPDVSGVSIPVVTPTWDPKAGDPKVSAELGGPGFTGEGWTTADVHQIGDPSAPQGGSFSFAMNDWPATTRFMGQNSASVFTTFTAGVMYDTLLELDPVTYEYAPHLATHWQISEDKSTYRFRLNPEAKWSDGEPITADDVIASWKLNVDPTLLDPSANLVYGKFEEPKAISPYIVEVKTKEESWRNFLYLASSMVILPEHEIGKLTGAEFIDKYQFSYGAVSGPYTVLPEDIKTGESITLTRRKDWWGEKNVAWDGQYNFEKITFIVVHEPQLQFEKTKKGEIDYFVIPKAQWWAEDIPALDDVKRGLLVPRKFFTEAPIGTSGLAINMKVAPLDDVNIRAALQLLYDRPTMIKKLFYDEYRPLTSYFQGATYSNPNNELFPYDEVGAVELLEKSGWTEKDSDGYRVKDGKRLSLTVNYRTPLSERDLTVYQEACKRAGIELELQLLTPATAWKNLQAKQFELMSMNWSGLTFPNPETSWKGDLADIPDNNNTNGFKDARVDELLAEYDREYDVKRRQQIIQEIDGILYAAHPYVLGWYNPSQRVLYWNKYGMPEWGVPRYATYQNMFITWWYDAEKAAQLEEARKDPSKSMERVDPENHFWEKWVAAKNLGTAKGDGG
ncbi:MAG: hypothetical protein KC621_15550 [Myxococcales bacterium]|nr:hypothetical protein [Myxococcales bacterium]